MKKPKREAKSTVSTSAGLVETKVILDPCIEDIVEHMCACAVSELSNSNTYSGFPNNAVLNRNIKARMVIRRT